MRNSISIISCEKLCLELPPQAHSFSLWKGIFPTTAVTFYNIEQPLHSLPRDPICPPPPPRYLSLVKCLILRVRNLKCIFLKCLLLYQLTSRQHFYFAKYLSRTPETWANQRPIVSVCNKPKKCNILSSVT